MAIKPIFGGCGRAVGRRAAVDLPSLLWGEGGADADVDAPPVVAVVDFGAARARSFVTRHLPEICSPERLIDGWRKSQRVEGCEVIAFHAAQGLEHDSHAGLRFLA